MTDLIIRHTKDEVINSLAAYLPGGELFESAFIPGTNFHALLAGKSGELLRSENFMFLYNSQFIPDNTTVFIEEWESAVGIPDDCFKILEDSTNEQRRLNILVKLASLGVQTAADFESLALILGFTGVEVIPGVGSDDESIINGAFDFDGDWTKGVGWTIFAGTANHLAGVASSISQDISAVPGVLYAVTYDVLNLDTGTVTPNIGGTDGVTRSENGTYEEVIQAGSTFTYSFPLLFKTDTPLFSMRADAAFNGSVDNISVRGSLTAGSTPRFTIVVKFTNVDEPIFPLDFPIFFGDPLLGILVCLFTKLKPANCDIVFLNIPPPPPPASLTLFSWGINSAGQLGLGDLVTRSSPAQVGSDEDWLAIAAGDSGFSLGVKIGGTLFSWGFNSIGQLGLGDTVNRSSPVQVGADEDWLDVSSGSSHTIALKIDRKLFSWGINSQGQLGLGDLVTRSSPVQVGTDEDWLVIAAGVNHSLALKTGNKLFSFGFNNAGQLGLGDTVIRSSPVQVGSDEDWAVISAGDNQSLAIKTDGKALAWGFNNNGQLGLDDTSPRSSPVQIGLDEDWATVSTGDEFSLGIKTDGKLFSFGLNSSGQLGLGDTINRSSPVQVGLDEDWSVVAAGSGFSLAIKTDGTAWAWGIGTSGQLGLDDLVSRSSPVQVGSGEVWAIVAAGVKLSLALRTPPPPALLFFSWGDNGEGQLGLGDTQNRSSPVQVGSDGEWLIAKDYFEHGLGIKQDNTLWAWGENSRGQLGLEDTTNRSSPVQVGTDQDWLDVFGNSRSSLALKIDGTIWSFGANSSGRLGLGDTVDRSSPVQIGTDTDWVTIGPGDTHNLAIKTDGTLWAWGNGSSGRLGLGDSTNRSSPVQVGTDDNWLRVEGGGSFTIAVKTDGTVYSWGLNTDGQLGLGDTVNRSSPVQIGTDQDWAEITAGREFALATKDSGTMYSWGLNDRGQLGLGDVFINRSSPVQIGTDQDWKLITAGIKTSFAIKIDGTALSWGEGLLGALGTGSTANQSSPIQIGTETDWVFENAGGRSAFGFRQT